MHLWRPVPPLALNFGARLEEFASDWLADRYPELQERLTEETGILMPDLEIAVDERLAPSAFQLLVHDEVTCTGQLGAENLDAFRGKMLTELELSLRRNAFQLLSLQQLQQRTQEHAPGLELLLQEVNWNAIRYVMVELARERVSLRNLPRILELMLEQLLRSRDLDLVLRLLRERIAGTICRPLERQDSLTVLLLGERVEKALQEGGDFGTVLQDRLDARLATLRGRGLPEVLVVEATIRKQLRRVTEYRLPDLHVLSYLEIRRGLEIVSVGVLELDEPNG
jgi:flagellar biosynthesis protein FlhA